MTRVALLLTLVAGVACGDGLAPEVQLQVHRERWQRAGIETYTLVVSRGCECLVPEMTGPVRVSVRSGAIESRTYQNGTAIPGQYASLFPDVPGLFEIIEQAIEQRVAELTVTYHPTYGVPLQFFIDTDPVGVDDEVAYTVVFDLQE